MAPSDRRRNPDTFMWRTNASFSRGRMFSGCSANASVGGWHRSSRTIPRARSCVVPSKSALRLRCSRRDADEGRLVQKVVAGQPSFPLLGWSTAPASGAPSPWTHQEAQHPGPPTSRGTAEACQPVTPFTGRLRSVLIPGILRAAVPGPKDDFSPLPRPQPPLSPRSEYLDTAGGTPPCPISSPGRGFRWVSHGQIMLTIHFRASTLGNARERVRNGCGQGVLRAAAKCRGPVRLRGNAVDQPAVPRKVTRESAGTAQSGPGDMLLWFGAMTNKAIPITPEHAGIRPRLSVPI